MRRTELDPRIVEWLKERLKGSISEKTIRPAISRIARKDASTLNEAAAKFAKKHGENLPRRFTKSKVIEKPEIRLTTSREPFSRPKRERAIIQFARYETTDKFLKAHLDEINKTYTYGCYTATFILCRKVLENLIIHHILKNKYPTHSLHDKEKYFDTKVKKRFHDFGVLLLNLRNSASDFDPDNKIVERICELATGFKEKSNDMAHSLYHIARKNEIDGKDFQGILNLISELEKDIK